MRKDWGNYYSIYTGYGISGSFLLRSSVQPAVSGSYLKIHSDLETEQCIMIFFEQLLSASCSSSTHIQFSRTFISCRLFDIKDAVIFETSS